MVREVNHQITGAKLPSSHQVLAVLFFNMRKVRTTLNESADLVIRECIVFWEKAGIPTEAFPNCVKKLVDHIKSGESCKNTGCFKRREDDVQRDLNNLLDNAHADAHQRMKIEKDKIFLKENKREPGRPGSLAGVDKN